MARWCSSVWHTLVATWESLQIELHGQYSLSRLCALRAYTTTASTWRVVAVLTLAPVPCLLAATITDAIPLAPPDRGINQIGYWLRSPLATFVYSHGVVTQLCVYVPQLRMLWYDQLLVTVPTTLFTTGVQYGLGCAIGFPVPFALPAIAQPWAMLLLFFIWLRRGEFVARHASVRKELVWFGYVLLCQLALVVVYPVFFAVFVRCKASTQTLCALLLPAIKLAAKNVMGRVLRGRDDVRPEIAIFNVEVFNALFVVCCMQSSTSIYTSLVLMAADFCQAWANIRDVHDIVSAFGATATRIGVPENELLETAMAILIAHPSIASLSSSQGVTSHGSSFVATHRIAPSKSDMSVKENAARVATIATATAPTDQLHKPSTDVWSTSTSSIRSAAWMPATIRKDDAAPTQTAEPAAARLALKQTPTNTPTTTTTTSLDAQLSAHDRIELVQRALRVLHVTEFLLLIEFTEVIVPVVYCIYLTMIFHLPNRAYYPQLRSMDDVQLAATIQSVLLYASMELVSFTALFVVLKRKLRLSAFHQLAFVLEKQARVVHAKLVLWVVFMMQSTLAHQGADYSFQFVWLRQPPQEAAT